MKREDYFFNRQVIVLEFSPTWVTSPDLTKCRSTISNLIELANLGGGMPRFLRSKRASLIVLIISAVPELSHNLWSVKEWSVKELHVKLTWPTIMNYLRVAQQIIFQWRSSSFYRNSVIYFWEIICVNTIKINDVGSSENYLKYLMEKCVFLQFLLANFSMLFSILYRGRPTFCPTASKAEDECSADLCGVLAQGAHQLSAKANGGICSLLKWADTSICLRTADLSDAWLRVIDP